MSLLNVRLSPEDAELVRVLRQSGVSIADVVRAALRSRAKTIRKRTAADTDALLDEMIARYPRSGRTRRRVDTTDRAAMRRAIRAKLRK